MVSLNQLAEFLAGLLRILVKEKCVTQRVQVTRLLQLGHTTGQHHTEQVDE